MCIRDRSTSIKFKDLRIRNENRKTISKTEYFVHGSAKLDSGIEINLTEFTNDVIIQRDILISQGKHRMMKEPINIMNSAHDYITKLIKRKLPV